VAAEVALALMLLVAATLLLGSFWRVTRVATGYRAEQLLTARISLPGVRYGNRDAVRRFAEELLPRLQAIPGVTIAAVADTPPLADDYNQMGMVLEGEPPRSDLPRDQLTAVTSRYFETLGIQLLAGRPFTAGDGQDAPPVAIVDRLVAKRIGGDPVGRRIRIGPAGEPWRTVIGVVAEVKRAARELPAEPQVYVPYAQRAAWDFSILLRSGLPVGQLASAAEAAVRAVDPGQPIYAVRTMEQLLGESVAHRRFTMQLVLLFGAAALGLAGLGIYGVVAHAAATRSREMAIRLALGACGRKVIRAVVGQGLRPVIAGVAAGTAGAIATSRAIAGLLYGTVPVEPVLYGGAVAFLFTVAVLAAWLPARRVARIDPMSVMRSE
jgi:putative ABC transport system permease protein